MGDPENRLSTTQHVPCVKRTSIDSINSDFTGAALPPAVI